MHAVTTKIHPKKTNEAIVKLPLSALRYVSHSPREKTIIIEVALKELKRVKPAETFDEIVDEARLDYALGNYTTHRTSKSLIKMLES